ncbi:MAG: energy-coupling factor transporter transmembrane protein EcfT, partial [Oscillospiraceae bacterium]|nr:energy-coupling factor transporter transmembrane protein EcfT [Oscillospiraceae bacterium]
ITLGQYFPVDSMIHKLDPRFKIINTMLFIIMLFSGNYFYNLIIGAVFVILVQILSKIPFKISIKSIKPILPILIFTAILNLVFIDSGETLWHWNFLKITEGGIYTSVFMIGRIILLILGSSLLTYTTSPILLTDAIEYLLSPLKKINFPVHEMAMMMSIALRFIPTLLEETDKIISAQKARGAMIDNGKLIDRVKAMIPILIPLFVSAFRRAEELATAMECRCYRGGEGRTRLRQLKATGKDYCSLIICSLFLIISVMLNFIIN